jgi:transglutaminase-like putative cysteine protease
MAFAKFESNRVRNGAHTIAVRCVPYIMAAAVAIWPISGLFSAGAGAIGAAIGSWIAHRLAQDRRNVLKVLLSAIALFMVAPVVVALPGASSGLARQVGPGRILAATDVVYWGLLALTIALALRTLTLRFFAFSLLEGACLVAAVASTFRGHRQFAYSQPQSLADWAFAAGHDPRHWIVTIGMTTLAGLTLLLLPRQNVTRTLLAVLLLALLLVLGPKALIRSPLSPLRQPDADQKKTNTVPPPPLSDPDPDPDEQPPSLMIEDAQVLEGNAGTTPLVFVVKLSFASEREVRVNYRTDGGTASPANDYRAVADQLTIPPGETEAELVVSVTGDVVDEPDEALFVQLTHPKGARIHRGKARGVIVNDDAAKPPSLTIDDVKVTEGNAGTTPATFRLRLSAPSKREVTVDYEFAGRTATAGTDFQAARGRCKVPAGELEAKLVAHVIGDTLVEPNEEFAVKLTKVANASLARAEAVGSILNDDPERQVPDPVDLPRVSIEGGSVIEGNAGKVPLVFRVRVAPPGRREVKLKYQAFGITADHDDFSPAAGTLIIAPRVGEATISVDVIGDLDQEPDETLKVVLSGPENAELAQPVAVGTIRNDDNDHVPSLSVESRAVKEGNAGATPMVFMARLTHATRREVKVNYEFAAATAALNDDFRAEAGVLVIPPGEVQATIDAQVLGDLLFEADETFLVKLSDPQNALLVQDHATGTILNDDDENAPPAASIENFEALEGNQGITPFSFRVRLTAPARGEVAIDYAASDKTARSGSDYRPARGTLLIPSGEREGSIVVQVIGDTDFERDETFQVSLEKPRNAVLAGASATGRIINDDEPDQPPKEPEDPFNWGSSGPNAHVPLLLAALRDDFEPIEEAYYFRDRAYSQLTGTRFLASEADDVDIMWSIASRSVELPSQPPRPSLRDVTVIEYLLAAEAARALLTRAVACERIAKPAASEFVAALRVTSQVLVAQANDRDRGEPPGELTELPAGDERWGEAQRRHYTRIAPNPRYGELARQIANTVPAQHRSSPWMLARAVQEWTGKNLLYDYNASHKDAADRTASFLFGDRRGYCVHLAHSMTMLLRSLGIPARVATGYRVGPERVGPRRAFLVYSSDAHAWCEIYLRGVGWTVVEGSWKGSLTPAQPAPDPREIDHYITAIDDVPREVLEEASAESTNLSCLAATACLSAFSLALAALYGVKAWRRLCPRLSSARQLPRVGYRAVLDRLADAGFRRHPGETWEEFAERLDELAPEFRALTLEHLRHQFARGSRVDRTSWMTLDNDLRNRLTHMVHRPRRWLGTLNPISWMGVG